MKIHEQQYEAPETTVLEVKTEGMICQSELTRPDYDSILW